MRRVATASAALLVFAAAVRAGDLDAAEKKWARACVESLATKSERARSGAEAALSALGTDAIPVVLGNLDKLKVDADRQALARAVAGMGVAGADALEAQKRAWPKGTETRLAEVVTFVRTNGKSAPDSAAPAPPPGVAGVAVPKSPPDVAEKVRALLGEYRTATMFSSEDPALRRIIGFGHAAFGALVQALRTEPEGHGMVLSVIAMALENVTQKGDEPAIAELLREGRLEAAAGFNRLRTPAALDALVDCVGRGFMNHVVRDALKQWRDEPRVAKALLDWLRAHGQGGGTEAGIVAEFLGESGVVAAVPILVPLLENTTGIAKAQVAEALTRLGEKAGIPALIEVVHGAGASRGFGPDDYPRHIAGKALNRVAGRSLYSGSFEPGSSTGNFDEAAKAFDAWWNKVKDTIRWDAARRTWVQ